jgi:hypothetical protein
MFKVPFFCNPRMPRFAELSKNKHMPFVARESCQCPMSSVTASMSAFFVSGSNNTSFDQWLHAPSKLPQEEDHDPALIVDRNHLRASNCFSSTPYCRDQSDYQTLPGSEVLARNSTCITAAAGY